MHCLYWQSELYNYRIIAKFSKIAVILVDNCRNLKYNTYKSKSLEVEYVRRMVFNTTFLHRITANQQEKEEILTEQND